jgi:hypothetical protein
LPHQNTIPAGSPAVLKWRGGRWWCGFRPKRP